MNIYEFRTFIEDNSYSGSTLSFVDQYSPKAYYTEPGVSYGVRVLLIRKAITIYVERSDQPTESLDRDVFVNMLYDIEQEYGGSTKCQLVLYNLEGIAPQAYLFDTMWSHMSSREPNVFEFTAPVDEEELHKGFFDHVIDIVTNPSLDGGC